MCGIFLSLCDCACSKRCQTILSLSESLISNRGPDHVESGRLSLPRMSLSYLSSVLWLQGGTMQAQPVRDKQDNLLMWNGDIFGEQQEVGQSDTTLLSTLLGFCSTDKEVLECLQQVNGPWAFVYIQKDKSTLWFGRDFFGRQSLLISRTGGCLTLASCAPRQSVLFQEVPALGVFKVDLTSPDLGLTLHPWDVQPEVVGGEGDALTWTLDSINMECRVRLNQLNKNFNPHEVSDTENLFDSLLAKSEISDMVNDLIHLLRQSVKTRIRHQPGLCKSCLSRKVTYCTHAAVAVLFSGGLDSAVLARLAAEELPPDQSLDLVNVAFQLPNGGYQVPDRLTGIQAFQELCLTNEGCRLNFVSVDVTKEELVTARSQHITHLLHPLNTVLDDSIGCAIWFAARAKGTLGLEPDPSPQEYTSPARVLLLGMGIDEQLAGYSRHRSRFDREGAEGLVDELKMELLRISERNLGRDNRIVSDHGVAARMPFLDEDLVNFLLQLPLGVKCDLRLARGLGEKLILRLAAHRLGLVKTAREPKRAVQFGSRIAKLENRKEKGNQEAVRG